MNNSIDSVLAIDAASRTGWALLDLDYSICSGFEDFSSKDGHGAVFQHYRRWLIDAVRELAPAVVAYEVPQIGLANRVSGNTARLLLGGLYGITMEFLQEKRIACLEVAPADAKKAATGRGNASKRDVMRAVRAGGFDVDNADQADAVAILLASMEKLGIERRQVVAPRPGGGLFGTAA